MKKQDRNDYRVAISPDYHTKLGIVASIDGDSMRFIVESALDEWFAKHKKGGYFAGLPKRRKNNGDCDEITD